MTYQELWDKLQGLSDEQLQENVMVEDPYEQECYPADFKICGSEHTSLDEDYPILLLSIL